MHIFIVKSCSRVHIVELDESTFEGDDKDLEAFGYCSTLNLKSVLEFFIGGVHAFWQLKWITSNTNAFPQAPDSNQTINIDCDDLAKLCIEKASDES